MERKKTVRISLVLALTALLAFLVFNFVDLPFSGYGRLVEKHEASSEFFPLEEVKPGMVGYGRTVLQGRRISVFKVEVLAVLPHPLFEGGKVVLAKLYLGWPFRGAGVLAGMSGSPIFLPHDGKWKLLGGLAFAYGNVPVSRYPSLVGITPISLMLDQRRGLGLERTGGGNSPESLKPIALPISLRGLDVAGTRLLFSADSISTFADFVFLPSGGRSEDSGDSISVGLPEPVPGSSISVALLSGAVEAYATGTVTYADSGKFVAFGHPFLRFGKVQMPAYESWIATPLLGRKLVGGRLLPLGTIVYDGIFGIEGVSENTPGTMLPVEFSTTVLENSEERKATYKFNVIRNRLFTGILVNTAVRSLLQNVWAESHSATAAVSAKIFIKGRPTPLSFYGTALVQQQQLMMGPFTFLSDAWERLFSNLRMAISALTSGAWDTEIEKISIDLKVRGGARALILDEAVVLDKADGSGKVIQEVEPGKTIYLRMTARDYRGNRNYAIFVPLELPKRFNFVTPAQKVNFLPLAVYIESGGNFFERDPVKIPEGLSQNTEEFLARIQGRQKDPSRIYIQLVLPEEKVEDSQPGDRVSIVVEELGRWQKIANTRAKPPKASTQRVILTEIEPPADGHVIDFDTEVRLKLLLPD